ncbi:hypothetical protein P8452_33049 [Trifolium repens]|nr:hypothetical protein P8452_33049 [Trifolium repens]
MDTYKPLINSEPLGFFTSIYFENKEYGEVNPQFIGKFLLELGPSWKISNFVDKSHYVTSNENIGHPLMTNGWVEMPNVFGFAGNIVIKLGYYGNNLFRLMSINHLQDNLEILVYHSRSMRYGNTSNFFVAMNTEIINRPYLSIFCHFVEYVRFHKIKDIKVCCDKGMTFSFNVAYTQKPSHTTSIGLGTKEFCSLKKFGPEDVVCFKFDDVNPISLTHVYKIG